MDTTEHTAPAVTDPERQFVGCLLSLPLSEVRPVLAGMQADDLASPTCGYVLQLVIELAADGTPPAPVAVYSHAISTGRAGGEHDRHRLSLWLAETYQTAQVPLLASYLKTVVLEAAWRRAVARHSRRLWQAVEHSPTDVLAELVDDTHACDDLWDRYQQACGPVPAPREPSEPTTPAAGRGELVGGERS